MPIPVSTPSQLLKAARVTIAERDREIEALNRTSDYLRVRLEAAEKVAAASAAECRRWAALVDRLYTHAEKVAPKSATPVAELTPWAETLGLTPEQEERLKLIAMGQSQCDGSTGFSTDGKIGCIKQLRHWLPLGLREAKDAIERRFFNTPATITEGYQS